MASEQIRLRIGNLGRAVLITGQAYQDPKDALNEFVSNVADEYAEAGAPGARIRVVLHRRGRHPLIAVEDVGRGMGPERLREVARNLFNSAKVDDPRTIGEKAIGMLAFQQIGGRCDIVSRAAGSPDSWVLRLERGSPRAKLVSTTTRARSPMNWPKRWSGCWSECAGTSREGNALPRRESTGRNRPGGIDRAESTGRNPDVTRRSQGEGTIG